MGGTNKYKEYFKNTFKSYKSKKIRSKGDRLGWLSFENVESVDLEKALANGEVVKLTNNNSPLLVP